MGNMLRRFWDPQVDLPFLTSQKPTTDLQLCFFFVFARRQLASAVAKYLWSFNSAGLLLGYSSDDVEQMLLLFFPETSVNPLNILAVSLV